MRRTNKKNDKNNKNKINTSTTNTNIIFLLQHNNSKNYMESNKEPPKYRLYENYYGIHRKQYQSKKSNNKKTTAHSITTQIAIYHFRETLAKKNKRKRTRKQMKTNTIGEYE